MNRRQERDIRVRGALQVFEGGRDERLGITKNISLSGLFLVTQPSWSPNKTVALKIIYRYWNLDILARVVHVQMDGVGFEFIDPPDDFIQAIKGIINSLLADGSWYDDQRLCLRTSGQGPVVWQLGEEEFETHLENISIKGAFIEAKLATQTARCTSLPPRLDSIIYVYLPAPSRTGFCGVVGCKCRVAHCNEKGFGVSFISPSEEFSKAIEVIQKRHNTRIPNPQNPSSHA